MPSRITATPSSEASASASVTAPASATVSASARPAAGPESASSPADAAHAALRRFRLPVPVRVQVQDGRPVRLLTDRRGMTGGPIVQAAGPWRTSGEWWNEAPPRRAWDRDEWDVAMTDGTVYRLYMEREVGQWWVEGVED